MGLEELSEIEKRKPSIANKSGLDAVISGMEECVSRVKTMMILPFPLYSIQKVYEIAEKRLESADYSEDEIIDCIIAGRKYEDYGNKAIAGAYTGALLSILTERNSKKGRKTIMYVDEKCSGFDYLFYNARSFDEVYLNNFNGDYACYGMENGRRAVVNNSHGDTMFWDIASGKIEKRDNAHPNAEMILINNYQPNVYFNTEIGSFAGAYGGSIGLFLANSCCSWQTGRDIAYSEGFADTVILNKTKGDEIGNGIACNRGRVNNLLIIGGSQNFVGNDIAQVGGSVGNLLVQGKKGKVMCGANFYRVERQISRSRNKRRFMEKRGIPKILALAEQMKTAGKDEIIMLSEQIWQEYTENRK
ncbi:MAG: hypothetical protein NTV63_04835 [Candidatus Woesearchaeota archaeon]|nr:hypothetical protein [Candidatus Woesearchaeota archaeon]